MVKGEDMLQKLLCGLVLFILISFAANTAVLAQKSAGEQGWETVLAQAKKEGSVTIYSLMGSKTRVALSKAFGDKYGINLEFSPFARGSSLVAKVAAESRAGLHLVDVLAAGNPTFLIEAKPAGLLGSLKPLLILPEVLDTRAWIGGRLPFADNDGTMLGMAAGTTRTVAYNTALVKEGEINSYKDLLHARYKGKISMSDPSVTGAGSAIIAHIAMLWGEEATEELLRKLIIDQGAIIRRDTRLLTEEVAKGKYAIAIAPQTDIVAEFMALGAPIKLASVKEDNRIIAGGSAIAVPTKFAHPNAALVFLNWLLTKEGQSVFATSYGNPSARIDASTKGINPILIPETGKKYYGETEESILARQKWLKIAKKIMDATGL